MLEEFKHANELGEVRELRLAKPPANAFTQPMMVHLTQRLHAAATEGARAVVISGQPGMFSGGLDLPTLIKLERNELQRFMRSGLALQHQLAELPIPVVAAITGHCAAAGAMLALFCDYRIMSKGNYKIGLNEVAVGLCPGRIAYKAFRRLTGARHADQLLTRGEFVDPEKAFHIGLVDCLVAPEQVIPEAIAFAQSYLQLPQQALYETRRIARADLVEFCDAAMRDDSVELQKRWFGDEAQQGLRSLAARLAK